MSPVLAEADAVIVGGGPAGLATALELRFRGRSVLVVDRALPPIDKACGEGVMPDGVQRLESLGVELPAGCFAEFRGIRYIDGDLEAQAEFVGGSGRGVRRPVLHQAMAKRAAAVGVQILWDLPVRGLAGTGVRTDRGELRARWIVGADGLHSRVRRWAGLRSAKARFHRLGVRRHFAVAPWTDHVEVHWSDGCEAYVTPVSSSEIGVAILWGGEKTDYAGLMRRFPELAARLQGAPASSRDRGAGRLEQRSRGVYRDRVALVGDAAGYRDAITGEGLSLALHQAKALAEAICRENLELYARAARRLTVLPYLLIRILLEVERRPRLRRRLIRSLADDPELFARLLAIHARQRPARSIGAGGVSRLVRGLLG